VSGVSKFEAETLENCQLPFSFAGALSREHAQCVTITEYVSK